MSTETITKVLQGIESKEGVVNLLSELGCENCSNEELGKKIREVFTPETLEL